ncbi:MAG: MFS transporter [Bacteroidota bacterium]|jgi:MFS family permease
MKPPTVRREDAKGLKLTFRALRFRNYRLFFGGQLISLIGTWMQQIAVTWLVYRLTNSAFLLGAVGFAGQMPIFIVTPFAGVFADRLNRHRILVATQTLSMVQATILAILTLTGNIQIIHIFLLSIFLGLINAFDNPTRQSFVLEMIENKEDLGNAIALNSSMFNSARLLGPSIAGIVIAAIGEGLCFLLNALSFVAVIIALLAMRIAPRERKQESHGVLEGFKEGFNYAFGFAPIKYILLLLALVSVMGMPYAVLMPIFARDILHGGPRTLGFLMGATGMGAVTGAIFLASRKSVAGLSRWIPTAASIFGTGLIAFSFSRSLWLSMGLLYVVGFGMMVQMASSNSILQTISDDDKRGRVMSFYAMAFMGMAPFGSLLAGSLASFIGAPTTLMISGICCIIGATVFAAKLPMLREKIRPIYMKIGIIPEVSSGIQAAAQLTVPPED